MSQPRSVPKRSGQEFQDATEYATVSMQDKIPILCGDRTACLTRINAIICRSERNLQDAKSTLERYHFGGLPDRLYGYVKDIHLLWFYNLKMFVQPGLDSLSDPSDIHHDHSVSDPSDIHHDHSVSDPSDIHHDHSVSDPSDIHHDHSVSDPSAIHHDHSVSDPSDIHHDHSHDPTSHVSLTRKTKELVATIETWMQAQKEVLDADVETLKISCLSPEELLLRMKIIVVMKTMPQGLSSVHGWIRQMKDFSTFGKVNVLPEDDTRPATFCVAGNPKHGYYTGATAEVYEVFPELTSLRVQHRYMRMSSTQHSTFRAHLHCGIQIIGLLTSLPPCYEENEGQNQQARMRSRQANIRQAITSLNGSGLSVNDNFLTLPAVAFGFRRPKRQEQFGQKARCHECAFVFNFRWHIPEPIDWYGQTFSHDKTKFWPEKSDGTKVEKEDLELKCAEYLVAASFLRGDAAIR